MKQTPARSQMRHSKQGAPRVHEIYDASAAAHKRKLVVNETNTSKIAYAAFKSNVADISKSTNARHLKVICTLPS